MEATDANSPQFSEMYTNLLAAKAGAAFLGEEDEELSDNAQESDMYEALYNRATLALAKSDLDGARRALETARSMC